MSRTLKSRTNLGEAVSSAPLRAAIYLRVSTGRQAAGEVSIPSQCDLTTRHCLANGWAVVDEHVEPGATATDDRRPAFQSTLERACDVDHPYDVISSIRSRGFSATGPRLQPGWHSPSGRAFASHGRGRRFNPYSAHH
jgi:hypothetical protein